MMKKKKTLGNQKLIMNVQWNADSIVQISNKLKWNNFKMQWRIFKSDIKSVKNSTR